ncbi:MAG: iron chelate uptake ABC transporter family permease subunit, partial [Planctomycetota bacterium]|nr:iron chelate uptake ABC transporter family permease subunit [Planctomycetota bacterium]
AIGRIGQLTGRDDLARDAQAAFAAKLDLVRRSVAGKARPTVLFVMGTERPSIAGDGTFIVDMIEAAGGTSVAGKIPGDKPWRQTQIDHILAAAPDVLLCWEDTPERAALARTYWSQWKGLPAAANGRVIVVSEPGWSIPSTRAPDFAMDLAGRLGELYRVAEAPAALSAGWAWFYRLLAAAIVGAALASAGTALQGLLRNPLAEPFVLGISSGAGVGVLMGMGLAGALPLLAWATTPVLAFVGAILTCLVVYGIAQRRGRLDPYSLILAGVIVNSFNAALMLVIYLYIDPYRIADFSHWAMGRLPDAVDMSLLAICGLCVFVGWVTLLTQAAGFNVLALGDEVAGSSGVRVHRLQLITFAAVGLMTAAAVALAGPIAFLGLIVPHICRMLLGPDHRRLIVVSALAGAAFLAAAEWLCRKLGPVVNISLIPVGIVTALAGGPFFIVLLRRRFQENIE